MSEALDELAARGAARRAGVGRRRRRARPPARPAGARPRRRGRRRPARAGAAPRASIAGGPAFQLSGAVRRLARARRPTARWQVDVTAAAGRRRSRRTSPSATSRSTRSPSRWTAARSSIRTAAPATSTRALPADGVGGGASTATRCACCALARFAVRARTSSADPATVAAAARARRGSSEVAAERVFGELKHVVAATARSRGWRSWRRLGLTEHVLPELAALRGVEQNRFHHLDVHDHTLAVLEATIELERDPAAALGDEHAERGRRVPRRAAGGRADARRRAALRRAAARRRPSPRRAATHAGRATSTFIGHDARGAQLARGATRLRASERLRAHVAALAEHHLRLGFLVHRAPAGSPRRLPLPHGRASRWRSTSRC